MTTGLVHSWQSPNGGTHLGVLVKRSFRMAAGRRATALDERPAVHLEPLWADANDAGEQALRYDSDLLAFERPVTDVLLRGFAHAPGRGATILETALRIGGAEKRVRVVGDRVLRLGPGGSLGASEPATFSQVPLEWARAYGGRDLEAERRRDAAGTLGDDATAELGTCSYPRNRAGRGFAIDFERERLAGMALPNLEDPSDPVHPDRLLARDDLDWIDRPEAACYGPIDLVTFPRCMHGLLRPDWSSPTRLIRELATGVLRPADLPERRWEEPPDPRLFNAAPSGLAVCRLAGNERLSLWHLDPAHELFEAELPGLRPTVWIEPPGAGRRQLTALLQEVLVEPEESRLTLTWTSSLPVAAVFPEPMCREMRHAIVWDG